MKKFILHSILFLAIMIVLDILAGGMFMLRNNIKTGTEGRINYVANKSEEEILILGSSRAVHHYNSRILEDSLGAKVYNMGVDANGLILASGIVRLEFQRHKPRLIIFELTPPYDFTSSKRVEDSKFLQNLKLYNDNPEVGAIISAVDPLEAFKLRSSLYRLNSSFFEFFEFFQSGDTLASGGFMPQKTLLRYEPSRPLEEEPVVDPVKKELFDNFLAFLKEENVDVIFTISPVYRYPTADYEFFKTYVTGKGYVVLDHLQDPDFVGNKTFFSDRVHLSQKGAELLTSKVANQLKQLYPEFHK